MASLDGSLVTLLHNPPTKHGLGGGTPFQREVGREPAASAPGGAGSTHRPAVALGCYGSSGPQNGWAGDVGGRPRARGPGRRDRRGEANAHPKGPPQHNAKRTPRALRSTASGAARATARLRPSAAPPGAHGAEPRRYTGAVYQPGATRMKTEIAAAAALSSALAAPANAPSNTSNATTNLQIVPSQAAQCVTGTAKGELAPWGTSASPTPAQYGPCNP